MKIEGGKGKGEEVRERIVKEKRGRKDEEKRR